MQKLSGKLTGWKDVFSFTLVQGLKSKAYRMSIIIMSLLLFAMVPVYGMITKSKDTGSEETNTVQKVYFINYTELKNLTFDSVFEKERFSHIEFADNETDIDKISERIEESEKTAVLLLLSQNGEDYSMAFYKAKGNDTTVTSIDELAEAMYEWIQEYKIRTCGVSEEQFELINTDINISYTDMSLVEEEDTRISFESYGMYFAVMIISFMVIIMGSSTIASSIATDKSTRVIEYLLISVKPLAIMVGKIMASLLLVMIQFAVYMAVGIISAKVFSGQGGDMISSMLSTSLLMGANVFEVILSVIIAFIGMFMYGTLAGICGASVSKIEELNESMTVITFTSLVSFYIGIGAVITLMSTGRTAFTTFVMIFPLTSPFFLPAAVGIAADQPVIFAIAFILLVAVSFALLMFAAKIYEEVIMHTGSRLKFKDLMSIARSKNRKSEVKDNE